VERVPGKGRGLSDISLVIAATCHGAVLAEFEAFGEETLEIDPAQLVDVCRVLVAPPTSFVLLSDLTCADFPDEPGRFRLAYHLYSLQSAARVRLRVWAGADDPEVDSVTSVWPTANFLEREIYDLMGVRFRGHPDLARIMMPDDWEGHPLRKDYPLGGEEVAFTDAV
jgi:NADH-quinone oxidoreductase subunit C